MLPIVPLTEIKYFQVAAAQPIAASSFRAT
jgi:hypothetical protein